MSHEFLSRLVRKAVVLGATLAVMGLAVGTVKVAADWRAAAAPLDAAPVGMETLSAQLVSENDRASWLSEQMGSVAGQVATLQSAVLDANSHVSSDSQSADALKQSLAATKAKLDTLKGQLAAAQARLAQLNAAAARQATLNAAAKAAPAPAAGGGGGGGD
jgi:chromosome segregation ATPase